MISESGRVAKLADAAGLKLAPRLPEVGQRGRRDLLDQSIALRLAPGEKSAFEERFVFPDRLPIQLLRLGIRDELLDGFLERWDVRSNYADLARRGPCRDEIARSFPRREVQRLLDPLATE